MAEAESPRFPHAEAILHAAGRPERRLVLLPGQIIGRGDVHHVVADPEVSEAHAMLSLREEGLSLLRLRGTVLLDGVEIDHQALGKGDHFVLSEDVSLEILRVHEPEDGLALEDPGGQRVPIPLHYACFSLEPLRESVAGTLETWADGANLGARFDGVVRRVVAGQRFGPVAVVRAAMPRVARTIRRGPVLDCTGKAAVLFRSEKPGAEALTFNDLTSKMLQGLAANPEPVHWTELAAKWMWRGEDPEGKRKNFENALKRIDQELARHRLENLVRKTGTAKYTVNRVDYLVRS